MSDAKSLKGRGHLELRPSHALPPERRQSAVRAVLRASNDVVEAARFLRMLDLDRDAQQMGDQQ